MDFANYVYFIGVRCSVIYLGILSFIWIMCGFIGLGRRVGFRSKRY